MVLAAPQIYRKYKNLLTDLVAQGFTVNPYDPCVVTKTVRGTQMTICWHVDDLKLSHKREIELKRMEDWLSMEGYTKEIIDSFPEVIRGTSATPAADHLFKTRENGKKLPEEQAAAFHRTTAQLLFLGGRARRDIQTAVAFLTTRVKVPDEDDWGKLKRVLKYLNGTMDMGLHLSVENLGIVRWYVDASYATHEDCKGHTGAMMTLGGGAAISISRKQKTNARSSTEAELIGVYDALPSILHARYFLEALGYKVNQNVVYQDNKSSITLEKHGRAIGSKRTKHIKVRYFFIKDVIEQGEVEIEHCPTKMMWSDILTKPKQGREFVEMRAKLLGHDVDERQNKAKLMRDKSRTNSVTPRDDSLRSPRRCVGGHAETIEAEVPAKRHKKGLARKLHVEVRSRAGKGRLLEPHKQLVMGLTRGVRAVAE
eukprot:CCRYP_018045-RC/>CCRYP_018045-RC protein AED:0.60 eAED:-0.09 QI:0/0/0/1/0/0/3/0/425